jgi:hypothetical protein
VRPGMPEPEPVRWVASGPRSPGPAWA